MNESDDRIDQALSRFINDEDTPEELRPYAAALQVLASLKQVPERSPERAGMIRQGFLERVANAGPGVSPEPQSRLKEWLSLFRKEHSPMFAIARIITLAAILLGGTAGTALAAQESLPDQALYPVKTLFEDMRLDLTTDPQAEFDLLMSYVQERFQEIEALVQNGEPVGEEVQFRLQNQLQRAFMNAAQLDDQPLAKAMQQVRAQSQEQLRVLSQLNQTAPQATGYDLGVAEQALIRSQVHAEGALDDPTTLRTRYGVERPEDAPELPGTEPPGTRGSPPDDSGEGTGPSGSGGPGFDSQGARRNGQSQ